jgi:peptidoglycan/xylan/chitin deacetylase (PgdA/CDA1 family)
MATLPMHHLGLWTAYRAFRRNTLRRREICVLGLHRVLSDGDLARSNSLPGLILREATFAELLKYLRDAFEVMSVSALLDGPSERVTSSRPICMVTFDDGWKDNYTTAFPLLKKYEIPAAIFLVTQLVENGARFWVERVIEAWRDSRKRQLIIEAVSGVSRREQDGSKLMAIVEFLKHMSMTERNGLLEVILGGETDRHEGVDVNMTWEQAAEMARDGVDFGGHTVNHPLLTFEDDATVADELQAAKSSISSKLGVPVRSFCYPNGDWDERIRKSVEEAGYECAFSTRTGWHSLGDDLFSIRRILIHERNVTNWNGEFSPAVFDMTLGRGW